MTVREDASTRLPFAEYVLFATIRGMSLSPLTPVTDYQSMLNRIFWFTSAAALVAIGMLRAKLPELNTLLAQVDFTLAFDGEKLLPVPGGYLLPALAIGLSSRIFRLHALLADWLGLRERFDIDVIIQELARRTGVNLDDVADEELTLHRHQIMRDAFYRFVGGRQPLIDEHLIHRALDSWSWFWAGLEVTVVFVFTGFAMIAATYYQAGFSVMLSALGFAAIGLPLIRNECRRYAIAQVREIVAEPARAELVRQALNCLQGPSQCVRRAA